LGEACASTRPDVLFMPESTNRASALAASAVDAATLELGSFLALQRHDSGRFHFVADFRERWPDVKTVGVHVSTTFLREHRETLEAYLAARVQVNRDVVANPSLLVAEATRELGDSPDWAPLANAYLDAAAWHQAGGWTQDDVARTLTFYQTHGIVNAALTPDAVANTTLIGGASLPNR
jgi:ABC-type nitrate/sulfonate/bicarbonate transport system substrate-binding protein